MRHMVWVVLVVVYIVLQTIYSLYYFHKATNLSKKNYTNSAQVGQKNKPVFKLFVSGDSVGAGVGASSFDKSVAGRVADYFSKDHLVQFESAAKTGTRMQDLINLEKPEEKQDVIVLFVSSNDLFRFTDPKKFAQDVGTVVETYSKLGDKLVIVGPGRVYETTVIPFFMRPIYKSRAKLYSEAIDKAIEGRKKVIHVDPHVATAEFLRSYGNTFASDKFHPNDEGHRFWFDLISAKL